MSWPRPVPLRLAVEYGLLLFGLVGLYALLGAPGGPLPALAVLGIGTVVYLRRQPDFDRRDLWRAEALRGAWPALLAAWAAAAILLIVVLALVQPARLFDLPRQQPLLWALIVLGYPLLSVYPQELIFRAFLLHRYAPVFRSPRAVAVASAAAFGFAHAIFGNLLAVGLTLAGGWVFARRFQRTRSLLVVSVEHAGYGLVIFTIGLGAFFYHGATSPALPR